MRCIRTLAVTAIILALCPAIRTHAQEALPSGSYQQTCSDVSVKKGNLYAKCKDEKGKPHSAKLEHYERCGSEIVNQNGQLKCSGGSAAAAAPGQPSGSYTETCKDIRMKGTTLYAVCRSIDGRERPTSLKDANRCSQGVINLNGILNCAVSDVIPPGSYMATCKDIRLQGTTLLASCNNGKERWLPAQLRDANKCSGDISNHEGVLRCVEVRKMERR
jgi:CVNH domain